MGSFVYQGTSVSISSDGNTAIVGGGGDNSNAGAVWVYTRTGGVWIQQGSKLVGTGAVGIALQGFSVSISSDGNTAIVGGYVDNSGVGAAWVYTRSGGVWTQQGSKLVGIGEVGAANQGVSVSISSDGNTAIVGGNGDNSNAGAAWVYTRIGGVWIQQGIKLVGTGAVGSIVFQGISVSISSDGKTAIVGGQQDNSGAGAAWVYSCLIIDTSALSICTGDSIYLETAWQTTAGTYYDTSQAANGCDSVVITALTVKPTSNTPDSALICTDDSIYLELAWQTIAGTYYDTLPAANGCDSVVITTLTVQPTSSIPDPTISICSGDSILIYGILKSVSGTYYDSSIVNGCDSIHSTVLIVNPTYSTQDPTVRLCVGDSAMIYNIYRSVSGTYYDSLNSAYGCDSVHYTELLTDTSAYLEITADISICDGDSILIFGEYRNLAGDYHDSLNTVYGCDSVIKTTLILKPLPVVSFTGLDSFYCINDLAVVLTGVPFGGIFTGPGMFGFQFDPATAGVGTHMITYSNFGANGCEDSVSQQVTVGSLSFTGLDSFYCINDPPALLWGTPTGGVFTGPGMSGSQFSPADAGLGTHVITYTQFPGDGCEGSVSQQVTVGCVGIEEGVTSLRSVQVYPNPNTGEFTIEMAAKEQPLYVVVRLINATGQEVFEKPISVSAEFEIFEIEIEKNLEGLFLLQIIADGWIANKKIIIEK